MLELKLHGQVVRLVMPGSWVDLSDTVRFSPAEAGWANDDGYSLSTYIPPEVPAPTIEEQRAAMPDITARQLCLTLYGIGITEDAIVTLLAGNPEGLIEWNKASTFKRLHPLVLALGVTLELPDTQIDALWAFAGSIA